MAGRVDVNETSHLAPVARFKKAHPCPICGGGDDMPRGKGERCSGYLSSDGQFAYCTREEHAGLAQLAPTDPPSYRHILRGECRCGQTHAPSHANAAVATYDYVNAGGELVFQVVRNAGKKFVQRRPGPDGEWIWNLHGVERVLYRLPAVLAAAAEGRTVYVVEGEKDVHAVEAAGAVATTNPGGAGKWRAEFATALAGATVVVVADRDGPGLAHAQQVAASLNGAPATIVQAAVGKDAADHLAAGRSLDEFVDAEQAVAPDPPDQPRAFNLTDVGNAERLIARHGPDLHYCEAFGRWLVYDGARWRNDETGDVVRRMKDTLRQLLADVPEIDDDTKRKALVRHIFESERASRIRGALELARSEPGVSIVPEDLDRDPLLLNVTNGTIDLRTGRLRQHDRAELLSKLAPVKHDPAARAPRWVAFLERCIPDSAVRAFLQQLAGYWLTGLTTEQILAIAYGSGANGKTVFTETTRALLGDYGQQAPAETFLERRDSIPNDVARLRGARFVAATEIGEGRRLNEALVKRMTGGDTIVARFMRGEWFEFAPTFKPFLATNHRPEIRGTDEAIWRRIRLIPFTETIPPAERDVRLAAKLRAELPGILNWALEGCLTWQKEGISTPTAVEAATSEYRADSDLVGRFIADCCTVEDGARVKTGDLFAAFTEWCAANGERALAQQALGRRLAERGLESVRTNEGRWWYGLTLRHDA